MARGEHRLRDDRAVADLIARAARGEQEALRLLYDQTAPKLFALCLRIVGDRGEAEEVLQEVYVTAWRRAGSFDPERSSPLTWLTTIARSRAIDRLRSAGRKRPAAPLDDAMEVRDPGEDALARLEGAEERQRLLHCLEELEDRQAQAIRSAFFGGHTYAELAELSAVPLGTMKSWIRRGLMQLKGCLER
ncbi:MAG TPA: sigma-70 family RNA polymerase sigma factor [Allosphingosinicella sp.]|nr:sigma-70 family RNA polymerase sigma factor [Allosphingosinicella sp.]